MLAPFHQWRIPFKCHRVYQRFYAAKNPEEDSFQYCLNMLRQKDFENYLCTLLMPKHARSGAVAVRAFNVEVAQIQDTVSERHIGKMRIQFWKDALNNIYLENSPSHPVAMAVSWAVSDFKLTKRWFLRLLEARDNHLDGHAFTNMRDAEEYGEKSTSSVLYLLLEILGIKNVNADHAASHLGKAIGLATLIRAMPYHVQARKVYLPTEVLLQHGVSHEDVIRRGDSQPVSDVVYDIASLANNHLEKARNLASGIPKNAFPALLSSITVDDYLTRLQQVDFNPFDPKLQLRNWRLQWTLLYSSFMRKL